MLRRSIVVIVIVGLLACVSAHDHLRSNRVPVFAVWNSTCEECQSLVHRFHDALKDEKHLNELKMLLRVLCHETSYVEECREFVSHLDEIVKKLEPYLTDAKAVCSKLHLCTTRTASYHAASLAFVDIKAGTKADIVCDECQFAVTEVKQLVDNKSLQDEARDFLRNNVCARLGKIRGDCDMVVEQFLPEFFAELEAVLANPRKVCQNMGFCSPALKTKLRGFLGFLQSL